MVKALEQEKDYRVGDRSKVQETSDTKKPTFRERVGDRDDRKNELNKKPSVQREPQHVKTPSSYSKKFHEGSSSKKSNPRTNQFEGYQAEDNNETTIYEDD